MRAVVYAVVALDDAHAGILRRSAHARIARALVVRGAFWYSLMHKNFYLYFQLGEPARYI